MRAGTTAIITTRATTTPARITAWARIHYKLIYFWKKNQWELYDLAKDPEELLNVYSDPAYAGTVKTLKEELYRLKKEVGDQDQFADISTASGCGRPAAAQDGGRTLNKKPE